MKKINDKYSQTRYFKTTTHPNCHPLMYIYMYEHIVSLSVSPSPF